MDSLSWSRPANAGIVVVMMRRPNVGHGDEVRAYPPDSASQSPRAVAHTFLLRDVVEEDLTIFYEQQLDAVANYRAAFTAKDPTDRVAFNARWANIMNDDSIVAKTIFDHGQVIGHVSSYEHFGRLEVSYWIGREFWGRGFATRALGEFLGSLKTRPLYARAARDNLASLRVLEKCGFKMVGEDVGFSNARGRNVAEFELMLI